MLPAVVFLQVMLGASAVLSNGTVLSRAGSAAVAMTAHASSKPVLVCCEAFKVGLLTQGLVVLYCLLTISVLLICLTGGCAATTNNAFVGNHSKLTACSMQHHMGMPMAVDSLPPALNLGVRMQASVAGYNGLVHSTQLCRLCRHQD